MKNIFVSYTEITLTADPDLTRWRKVRPSPPAVPVADGLTWHVVENLNENINRRIKYKSDNIDEWQTADFTQSCGTGDCEDYAILKYRTLLHLGVPEDRLCFVLAEIAAMPNNQPHAFLIVELNGERRVLDNKFDKLIAPDDYLNLIPKKGFSGDRAFLFGKQFTING